MGTIKTDTVTINLENYKSNKESNKTPEVTFNVTEDELIRYTDVVGYNDVKKREVILTKDMFIACYNKWINKSN